MFPWNLFNHSFKRRKVSFWNLNRYSCERINAIIALCSSFILVFRVIFLNLKTQIFKVSFVSYTFFWLRHRIIMLIKVLVKWLLFMWNFYFIINEKIRLFRDVTISRVLIALLATSFVFCCLYLFSLAIPIFIRVLWVFNKFDWFSLLLFHIDFFLRWNAIIYHWAIDWAHMLLNRLHFRLFKLLSRFCFSTLRKFGWRSESSRRRYTLINEFYSRFWTVHVNWTLTAVSMKISLRLVLFLYLLF